MTPTRDEATAELLDTLIARIGAGETPDAAAAGTDVAEDLVPALRLAATLGVLAPAPDSEASLARARVRASVMAAAQARLGASAQPQFGGIPRPAGVAVAAAAAVVASIGSGGAIVASAGALPGEALYPVKLVVEQTQVAVTSVGASDAAQVQLQQTLAQRRVDEAAALVEMARPVPASVIEASARHAERAAQAAQRADDTRREQIASSLAEAEEVRISALQNLATQPALPPPAQTAVARAIRRQPGAAASGGRATSTPTATRTPSPSASPSSSPTGSTTPTGTQTVTPVGGSSQATALATANSTNATPSPEGASQGTPVETGTARAGVAGIVLRSSRQAEREGASDDERRRQTARARTGDDEHDDDDDSDDSDERTRAQRTPIRATAAEVATRALQSPRSGAGATPRARSGDETRDDDDDDDESGQRRGAPRVSGGAGARSTPSPSPASRTAPPPQELPAQAALQSDPRSRPVSPVRVTATRSPVRQPATRPGEEREDDADARKRGLSRERD